MSRSVGIGTCSRFLEWRMFFVGEPVSTSPEHALAILHAQQDARTLDDRHWRAQDFVH